MSKLNHARDEKTGIEYVLWWCPGCREPHQVTVNGQNTWTWNGSEDAPTFSPSVLVRNGLTDMSSRCHCFVVDGVIDFLPDCKHAFAGQKVPMPSWEGYDPDSCAARGGTDA